MKITIEVTKEEGRTIAYKLRDAAKYYREPMTDPEWQHPKLQDIIEAWRKNADLCDRIAAQFEGKK